MLLRVFINLVSNSVDAIKNDGTVTIDTTVDDDVIVSHVRDTGEGITPESMAEIFQPLFTTKTKGVGLGRGS